LDGGSARQKVYTYTGQHRTQNRGHVFTARDGFEHTIPVFEQSKTACALDCFRPA